MVNYKHGKIYKIYGKNHDMVYYGSTCKPICNRKAEHKNDFKRFEEGKNKKKTTSFNILKTGDYIFELVQNFPCNNKEELREREDYYIKNFPCINKNRGIAPTVEEKKEYKEIWYQINKERILKKMKEKGKIKFHCECGSSVRQYEKARHYRTKKHIQYLESL